MAGTQGVVLSKNFNEKLQLKTDYRVIEDGNPCLIGNGRNKYYIFFRNISWKGNPYPEDDLRAQLPEMDKFEYIKKSDIPFLFLGYYDEFDVYVCWQPNAIKQRLNVKSYVSFYIKKNVISKVSIGSLIMSSVPETYDYVAFKSEDIPLFFRFNEFLPKVSKDYRTSNTISSSTLPASYLTAMRTKPFLLLAGISGTGKSRIVKQLAYESCPDKDDLQSDMTSPGNYQLIEVKPNWHDSTEVLGYESEIGGSHYVLTPFVRFLVKAMRYEAVCPFFVCMDEMNLALVEQYFAEFLSVLESRKVCGTRITSEPLVKAEIFAHHEYEERLREELCLPDNCDYNDVYEKLKTDGLRLPSNLIVIGTVNMDETTHQFSRKVIDRAMTIEMNIEDAETPFQDFFNSGDALHYYDNPQPKELFLPKVVQAADALAELKEEDAEYLKANVPQLLFKLNQALNGTPFKIAYRVQNELVLYFYSLREEQPDAETEELLASAMDAILMMKVLPRIEGDEDLLEKPLKALAEFTADYPQSNKKIAEMQSRLPQAHFTSFWP